MTGSGIASGTGNRVRSPPRTTSTSTAATNVDTFTTSLGIVSGKHNSVESPPHTTPTHTVANSGDTVTSGS